MRSRADRVALALLVGAYGMPAGAKTIAGDFDRVGIATWYGEELKGARTASGTPFDPSAITAAHRTLPLNSYVDVTALDTGRTLRVLVNDRGPGRRDREIDLSRRAAQMLGIDRNPKAMVRIRAVRSDGRGIASPALLASLRHYRPVGAVAAIAAAAPMQPVLSEASRYTVRVATFSTKARAQALADSLKGNALRKGDLWRVQLGPFKGGRAAQRARDAAVRRGYGDARILAD